MKPHTRIQMEILEDRIAPAGVITVAYTGTTGELTLTGDIDSNVVHVFRTGTATHRIEGLSGTTLTGGATFLDIGKITKLTIAGDDGLDIFTLDNLTALTSLSFDSGPAGGSLLSVNTTVKGPVVITGGDGSDSVTFDGLSTLITGNVTVNDAAGGDISLDLNSQKAVIGGSVVFTGGSGSADFRASGPGTLNIARGVNFSSGVGGGNVNFSNQAGISIGKLPTGESILFTGGDGADSLLFFGRNAMLAGGIRMTGGLLSGTIQFSNETVRIGKLVTGQSILFDGGADDDTITTTTVSFTTTGAIEFAAGAGDNSVSLGGSNGKIALGKLATGESIKITGDVGDDTLSTDTTSLTLAGAIDFAGSDGSNAITLNSANGTIKIGKLPTGASIKYTGAAGIDSITTTSHLLQLAGGIDFNGDAGANSVAIEGANGKAQLGKLVSGESVKFTGLADDDTFATDAASFSAIGGISFASGDGINNITFNGYTGLVKLGKLATGQSIFYTGGAGDDNIVTGQAKVVLLGGIEFVAGDGSNDLAIDYNGSTQIGTLTTGQSVKLAGGSGRDRVFFGGHTVSLKGSIELNGGDGDNTIDLDGAAVSVGKNPAGDSIVLTGGNGADLIDLEDAETIAGSIKLDGGAGADLLDLTDLASLKVGGSVTLLGGADDDSLMIDAFRLQITGNLTVTGGDGIDTASIFADGIISGNANINLGLATAGDQSASLTSRTSLPSGLGVKGTLSFAAAGDAATTDSLTITNIAVAKAITANLGAGISTVAIDNLRASDIFTLDTGDGADVVDIERGNFIGNSIITKLATIQAGIGNDIVRIGSATPAPNGGLADSTRVRFLTGLTVDGGADDDSRNDYTTENDFPVGGLTISNFEIVVP